MSYKPLIDAYSIEIEKQFIANEIKYPEPSWSKLTNTELINEVYYHVGKLQISEKAGNLDQMKENCGDLGAIVIMFMDNNKILFNE